MPREETTYVCSHEGYPSCRYSSTNKASVQYHERRHEIDELIDEISDVHDHLHFVQEEVIEFLEDWLEHGKMASVTECVSCGAEVHELLDQCPECYGPVGELQEGTTLSCGECGETDSFRVMRKDGTRQKFGVLCTACDTFAAHGDGVLSFWSNHDKHEMGEWAENDA